MSPHIIGQYRKKPHGEDTTHTQMVSKVTETIDALDLEPRLFRAHDPKRIAASLKLRRLFGRATN
ncbi:MAG: DUF3175 domain-containing protein [Stellaceae bacterium]